MNTVQNDTSVNEIEDYDFEGMDEKFEIMYEDLKYPHIESTTTERIANHRETWHLHEFANLIYQLDLSDYIYSASVDEVRSLEILFQAMKNSLAIYSAQPTETLNYALKDTEPLILQVPYNTTIERIMGAYQLGLFKTDFTLGALYTYLTRDDE